MKAILISIKPKYVAKILNGEKTIEIRKRFPSDYVGWVYIYCTKDSKSDKTLCYDSFSGILGFRPNYRVGIADNVLNGKVVARFWCDKVEDIAYDYGGPYEMFQTGELDCDMLNAGSCLTDNELKQYLKPKREHGNICGKTIHITKLEIFDKPREIKEFTPYCELCGSTSCCNCKHAQRDSELRFICCDKIKPLTRAPQSWCYIEV